MTPAPKPTLHLAPKPTSGKGAQKRLLFDREFTAFWGNVGDTVSFKSTRSRRTEWRVAHIETEWDACKWTKGGKKPLFIKLEREVLLAGAKRRVETCYTCTSALQHPKGWNV